MSKKRLIDADALMVNQASIAKTFAKSDAQKALMGRVLYNTDHAPTIDAIPMDWMDEQIHGYASRLQSTELKALLIVSRLWEKDQEAR